MSGVMEREMNTDQIWTEKCPYCGGECEADFVDVGPGMVQCGPFHCDQCRASQIGPYDKERNLSEREEKTGFYAPQSEPGSSANVIGGRHVTHRQMAATYQGEFRGNVLWHDKSYVDDWWEKIRK